MQKNGIVRSSQANRRPNVTKASVRSPRDSVRYPLTVCGDPTTTVRPPCVLYQRIGTLYGQRTGSVRYLRTICGDIRLPYDRLAFLYENVDKWQIKKSHDARMNC